MTRYLVTNDLLTGNAEIDHQHRSLFALANEVLDTESEPDNEPENAVPFFAVLGFLAKYVDEHFAAEEAAMLMAKYPGLAKHQQFHTEFKLRVAAMLDRSLEATSLSDLRRELSRAITVLLVRHIRVDDKSMATYLKDSPIAVRSTALQLEDCPNIERSTRRD